MEPEGTRHPGGQANWRALGRGPDVARGVLFSPAPVTPRTHLTRWGVLVPSHRGSSRTLLPLTEATGREGLAEGRIRDGSTRLGQAGSPQCEEGCSPGGVQTLQRDGDGRHTHSQRPADSIWRDLQARSPGAPASCCLPTSWAGGHWGPCAWPSAAACWLLLCWPGAPGTRRSQECLVSKDTGRKRTLS